MSLRTLFAKLNDPSRQAMEEAAGLCLGKRQYEVEIEHLLLKLLEIDDNDVVRVCRHGDVALDRLADQLDRATERFKTGCTRTPALSPHISRLIERAWMVASIEHGGARIRSGHLLQALLDDQGLRRVVTDSAPELERIDIDELKLHFDDLLSASPEAQRGAAEGDSPGVPAQGMRDGKTPALDRYTIDLTANARAKRIDPVLGRDGEIRQMIDILTRRRQNNPILTGEAGVGKTAVVEGLALKIVEGRVPQALVNVELRTLDLGLLQAGAGVKGEFEQRLKDVIEEVKRSLHPIILFIDEAHTLIGSGGQAGQGDAANLLKPALARGELRTIAATTWAEYKKYFEKDAALARRFQVIKVDEPTEDVAIDMLRGLAERMREHHKVEVLDDAVVQAVRLSHRYISGRQLPDKAVSVLDTACARVALGQAVAPPALEDARQQVADLDGEYRVLTQEQDKGSDHAARLAEIDDQRDALKAQIEALERSWQTQRSALEALQAAERELADAPTDEARDSALESIRARRREFEQTVDGEVLVHPCVDGNAIGAVVAAWTGIPLTKMQRDEIDTVRMLPQLLAERVIGQDHALEEIGKRISLSRAKLEDPSKPVGVFLLLGPSGVGKTETALALADTLYGGERNLITINMSEYQEAHTVSSLKGSPPGYVGYGEGGVLTEAVRRKPYSVVLLDEVEKAHPDVLELFFQVFDKGVMEDGEGREIDFRHSVILLTSNVGTEWIMQRCLDVAERPEPDQLVSEMTDSLNQVFKPAFLGRLKIVPYYPVQGDILTRIVDLKLSRLAQRFQQHHDARLAFDDDLALKIAERCTQTDSGARSIDHLLTSSLMPALAEEVLGAMVDDQPIDDLVVGVDDQQRFTYRKASSSAACQEEVDVESVG
ncbi:type VI secretion system ATPase TssH [Halomonas sp. DP8Y7-3]|uniref:type VI secretion system ATPase TssH n=1 Tax=Halomonas sp. DP8Y7-3 TaxID=2859079 RepID=UPI001C97B5EA|nr:type VI secretion system ATPase TssH [Halomonas sp. DP8Y7-3]MBY5929702.1 type VI secretion system ATPase TssH [Halomonas sp. DP8Y7-3]